MIRFYKTPWFTKKFYPSLVWNIPCENSIYLTFDDGPHNVITPWVLDQLAEYEANATFFNLGENVAKHPELTKEIVSKGHSIANHTYKHVRGWDTEDEHYSQEVTKCDEEFIKIGISSDLFRPPYGRIKRSQIRKLKHKKIIMWSHLSWDFQSNLNLKRSLSVVKSAKPGDILLFHESEKAFKNLKILLPEVLKYFQSKGYKIEAIQ